MIRSEDRQIFNQQIDYAVNKYSSNRPPSLVRLEALEIAQEAYKNFDPKKANLKTHLSSALKKLSRESYRASSPLKTTEKRNVTRHRVSMFKDEFIDRNGIDPTSKDLSLALNVSDMEAQRMLQESRIIRTESNYGGGSSLPSPITKSEIIRSLHPREQSLANDLFLTRKPLSQIIKERGTSRDALSRKRSRLAKKIRNISTKISLEESYV